MAIKKLKQMRIYGYRRDRAFKIWFDIEFEPIHFKRNKGKEREMNLSKAIKLARKEARRLNKLYRYYNSEKIVWLIVDNTKIEVY
ncbi:MAG: hypothetical protein ACTSQY_09480 [Candidatus Odinarchaeia archaeon]